MPILPVKFNSVSEHLRVVDSKIVEEAITWNATARNNIIHDQVRKLHDAVMVYLTSIGWSVTEAHTGENKQVVEIAVTRLLEKWRREACLFLDLPDDLYYIAGIRLIGKGEKRKYDIVYSPELQRLLAGQVTVCVHGETFPMYKYKILSWEKRVEDWNKIQEPDTTKQATRWIYHPST